jgi:DNA mismatch endonuclease (patch repair protein)
MAKVRSRGNLTTEVSLAKALRRNGVTGWRRHRPIAIGNRFVRPDFVFPKKRLAVFVDGCFWHACPWHGTTPTARRVYWISKFEANKARDRRDGKALRKRGWKVLRIWEHNLRWDADGCARKIAGSSAN